MNKPNRKSKPQPNSANRTATEIIAANPTRRSRSERAMLTLTTSSYPHYLLGNVAHSMFAGDAAQCKKALDIENKFGLLDFIREITLEANEQGLTFTAGWLRIDGASVRIDNQLTNALTKAEFKGDLTALANLRGDTTLAQVLVDSYHRGQVRGMTRVHDINAKHWKLVEKKLTVGSEGGFGGLGRTETVFEFTAADAIKLINDTLETSKFAIQVTPASIVIAAGESTLEITYVVPAKN